jgi:serine-type D-Ala-D-Ala carboxypeptidase
MASHRREFRALEPGSRVAVVAPAGPVPPDVLTDGLAVLRGFGWCPIPETAAEIAASDDRPAAPYLAASDAVRAARLRSVLADPSVDAVFAARGGYGTARLLADLDPAGLRAAPKPIIGFSDITALLNWAACTAGVPAVHGPNVATLGRVDAASHQGLHRLLTGAVGPDTPLLAGLSPLREGVGEGRLLGGNLAIVTSLAGTRFTVPLAGAVLLLEDTNEPAYRLDRMLTQLAALPGFDELAGIVLGRFTGVDDPAACARLFAQLADTAPCPVVTGAPVGHGRENVALPLGVRVRLDAGRGELVLRETFIARPSGAPRRSWSLPAALPGAAEGPPAVRRALEEAVRDGVAPGFALWVAGAGTVVCAMEVGYRTVLPAPAPLRPATRFDVASLTKPIVTTTLAMLAVQRGALDLDRPIVETLSWLPQRAPWASLTARHLLQHAAGLPDWLPLHAIAHARLPDAPPGSDAVRGFYRERLAALSLEGPPGVRVRYSDVGYWLLGALLETLAEMPLGWLFARDVAGPLGLEETGFRPLSPMAWDTPAHSGGRDLEERFAATEFCPWRGRVLCGEVHDENAYALGGVAPHAGLFATAADVGCFGNALLQCAAGSSSLLGLDPAVVASFWDAPLLPGGRFALGWDRPEREGASCGRLLSRDAVGHLGFTGCSLWIERERRIVIVLLSNRVHPDRHDTRIRALRPRLHDLIVETF